MQTVSDPLKGFAGNMRLIAVYGEPPARPVGSFYVLLYFKQLSCHFYSQDLQGLNLNPPLARL